MHMNDFIKLREKDWERLQKLLDQYQARGRMGMADARQLGSLYRAITSDLAQARRDYPDQRLTIYLNQLLIRTHSAIYRQEVTDFRRWLRYLIYDIPQTFRETGLFIVAAFLLFMIPGIIGFRLTTLNPDFAEPLGLSAQRELLEDQDLWTDIPLEARSYASTFIMSNNIRVALLAFGGGITFGAFTVYILMMNGLIIGATLGLATYYGAGQELLDFIFAHGVIELSVIFMAGGAGLMIGWAMLNPGMLTRRDSLNVAAQRAVKLAIIGMPILVIAGLIEGFISPSELSFAAKVAVGLLTGLVMYSYLLWSGRQTFNNSPALASNRLL